MTESDKILTPEYLDWHAKLSGLPSVLTDKIRSKLYKRYKKQTGNEPWQLSEAVIDMSAEPVPCPERLRLGLPQASDFKPIIFEARPDPESIIQSVLEHLPYLKFRNSFRGSIIIILHHLSREAHHVLFVMENMGIMDYMVNGMEQNIVLLASLQANSRS